MPVRFILLCQPRTGSSELVAALQRHPDILMRDEILNPHKDHSLPENGEERFKAAMESAGYSAVGFKLHAFQPLRYKSREHWESVWRELGKDAEIRILVLRRDELTQLAAIKTASINDDWTGHSELNGKKIRIDQEEFFWFQRWNQLAYDFRLSGLSKHPKLSMAYESLSNNWEKTIGEIWKFLGVAEIRLPNPYWGINAQALLENHDEFKQT